MTSVPQIPRLLESHHYALGSLNAPLHDEPDKYEPDDANADSGLEEHEEEHAAEA